MVWEPSPSVAYPPLRRFMLLSSHTLIVHNLSFRQDPLGCFRARQIQPVTRLIALANILCLETGKRAVHKRVADVNNEYWWVIGFPMNISLVIIQLLETA